ncbi:MAG TPA: PAS domain-containing protein [Atopostipes sp.]|nr:PAS domain-containing protein [Atopostipes sp.]
MCFWKKLSIVPLSLVVFAGCASGEADTASEVGEENQTEMPEMSEVAEAPSIDKGDTVETTIDIENSDQWVEEAAEVTEAASGDDYVQLDRGVLTVNQISDMLKHLPMEITFADENSQFLYYNYREDPEDMLAARAPEQVGDALTDGHPQEAQENMQRALDMFYAGEISHFQRVAESEDEDVFKVITYQGVYDDNGEYKGIAQYAQDIQPIIDFYLEETGMMLVEDPDAVSGATAEEEE